MRSSTSHGSTDWACPDSPDLKLSNRLVRTRMPGGVAGEPPVGGPLCRLFATQSLERAAERFSV